ncbi:MAG TPA: hypothetical protein DEQ30_02915 [Porphyromonadaceae bacterium]|nr:hypothetical protein [Porphyromonadaceae bacterium]
MTSLSFTVLSPVVFAQTDPVEVELATNTFDLSTFAGIVACISLIVTQLAKTAPAISEKAILKILMSLAIGIGLTFFAWWLNIAPFLGNMIWWQVLIQGILSGGAACGIYDLIKSLFSKQE